VSWDLFISYASEDKEEIARPLAKELARSGLAVWFDEFELKLGDSLLKSIDKGLSRSRYGVVILSHAFFRSTGLNPNWPDWFKKSAMGEKLYYQYGMIFPQPTL
jgi:TIR domain